MAAYAFQTVDVFTDQQFGGNPLAVFTDAANLADGQMQALAREMNLSETTFVLPPSDPAHTARVRIFNRTAEMAFAGHPSLGTAWVIARQRGIGSGQVTLEVPAGLVEVELTPHGGDVAAPQPLSVGQEVPIEVVAACAGVDAGRILTTAHRPCMISMGNSFVAAEVDEGCLAQAAPNLPAFQKARASTDPDDGRFSLLLYERNGEAIRARMFAPLAGTWEDPATGSANAPLAGLLLSLTDQEEARFEVTQGVEMGRPSSLRLTARRAEDGIRATVGGDCVPVLRGEAIL